MEQQLTTRVEIADAIRADPELLCDVEAATAYLVSLPRRVEPPALVRWSLAPTQPDRAEHRPAVVVTLGDWPEFLNKMVTSDPLSRVRTRRGDIRERAVFNLWTRLLQNRSEVLLDFVAASLAGEIGESNGD